ncbi:MAG: hypothetical protein QXU69_10665 [Thermofilaceae archaeon]
MSSRSRTLVWRRLSLAQQRFERALAEGGRPRHADRLPRANRIERGAGEEVPPQLRLDAAGAGGALGGGFAAGVEVQVRKGSRRRGLGRRRWRAHGCHRAEERGGDQGAREQVSIYALLAMLNFGVRPRALIRTPSGLAEVKEWEGLALDALHMFLKKRWRG